jgi:hypothetical protein
MHLGQLACETGRRVSSAWPERLLCGGTSDGPGVCLDFVGRLKVMDRGG